MNLLSRLVNSYDDKFETDFVSLGNYATAIFFASEYDRNGNDPLLMTLFESELEKPRNLYIDALNHYLVDGSIDKPLETHFRNALDIQEILRKRVDFGLDEAAKNLEDFIYGFKFGLTRFHDWYRNYFQEAEPLLEEWRVRRQLHGFSGWNSMDAPYELKMAELRKKIFRVPISDITSDFVSFFTRPLVETGSEGVYEVGAGLILIKSHQMGSSIEIVETESFRIEDYFFDPICLVATDEQCWITHQHKDSISHMQFSATRSQLESISISNLLS